MMNSEFQEQIGALTVSLSIIRTKKMCPSITLGDRYPSWDGDVRIYPNDENTKDTLIGRVPVQVKGRISSDRSQKMTYNVEVADLRNFLNDGGAIYFVVHMDNNGEKTKIYFKQFLPFSLRNILDDLPPDQKTKSIQFKEFPNNHPEKEYIFRNFLKHKDKQASITKKKPLTEEELKEKGLFNGCVFGFIVPKSCSEDPFKYAFKNENFLYATTPLSDVPLKCVDNIKKMAFHYENAPVCIGNKVYFNCYDSVRYIDHTDICLGKNIVLSGKQNSAELNFEAFETGTYKEQINDCEFLLDFFSHNELNLGGDIKKFEKHEVEKKSIDIVKRKLKELYKLREALKTLGLKEKFDINLDEMNHDDSIQLYFLVKGLIDKKPIAIEFGNEPVLFISFDIGKFNILTSYYRDEKDQTFIKDLWSDIVPLDIVIDGQLYRCSPFTFLREQNFVKCCNLDYQKIVKDIKSYSLFDDYVCHIIHLILEMLSAYDKQQDKNVELLEAALSLGEYLYKNEQNNINLLNYCQVLTRKGELSTMEKKKLSELMGSPSSTFMEKLGAAILLEDFEQAEKYYQQLSETERKDFDGFPINNLWEKETND